MHRKNATGLMSHGSVSGWYSEQARERLIWEKYSFMYLPSHTLWTAVCNEVREVEFCMGRILGLFLWCLFLDVQLCWGSASVMGHGSLPQNQAVLSLGLVKLHCNFDQLHGISNTIKCSASLLPGSLSKAWIFLASLVSLWCICH